MNFKYDLTDYLKDFLNGAVVQEIDIGCSDSLVVKITKDAQDFFLKCSDNPNIKTEYQKLKWLQGRLPVAELVYYAEQNGVNYLLTRGLAGEMVCSEFYRNNWRTGLDVILAAFDALKNTDITDCPFNVGLDYKLSVIKHNIDNNLIKSTDVRPDILLKHGGISGIYEYLIKNRPTTEELVLSHGDTSLPNIFGRLDKFIGFIDVADCGVADFWYDVAITAKSIRRNYNETAVQEFYRRLGRDIPYDRIEYYITLVELCL